MSTPSGRRFWVGDLHLGHRLVADTRGLSVTEHDDLIMSQLMALGPTDQVWLLGDLSSSKPGEQRRALSMLAEVPAQLDLIAGNHDAVSSIHRQGYKLQREYL